MRMCRREGGFTIIELMVSAMLMGTMLATVWGTLATGQSAFNSTEAALYSYQSVRNVVDILEQDLSTAQLYSYYNDGNGNGKVYVKFRRPNNRNSLLGQVPSFVDVNTDGVPDVLDSNGKPLWEGMRTTPAGTLSATPLNQMRMYAWCLTASGNPCSQIQDVIGNPLSPAPGQLLLLRAHPTANTNAEISLPWILDRVIVRNLDWNTYNTTPATLPFAITNVQGVQQSNSLLVGVPSADASAAVCLAPSPLNSANGEGCVNRRAHTAPLTPAGAFIAGTTDDILPIRFDVVIRTNSSRMATGIRADNRQTLRGTVTLRNPQN